MIIISVLSHDSIIYIYTDYKSPNDHPVRQVWQKAILGKIY